MSLFRRKKEETPICSRKESRERETNESSATDAVERASAIRSVKVLGAGCGACRAFYENARQAVKDAGLEIEVEYVTDMEKVVSYGVMSLPALVIDERVAASGRVLKAPQIAKLLGKG